MIGCSVDGIDETFSPDNNTYRNSSLTKNFDTTNNSDDGSNGSSAAENIAETFENNINNEKSSTEEHAKDDTSNDDDNCYHPCCRCDADGGDGIGPKFYKCDCKGIFMKDLTTVVGLIECLLGCQGNIYIIMKKWYTKILDIYLKRHVWMVVFNFMLYYNLLVLLLHVFNK